MKTIAVLTAASVEYIGKVDDKELAEFIGGQSKKLTVQGIRKVISLPMPTPDGKVGFAKVYSPILWSAANVEVQSFTERDLFNICEITGEVEMDYLQQTSKIQLPGAGGGMPPGAER